MNNQNNNKDDYLKNFQDGNDIESCLCCFGSGWASLTSQCSNCFDGLTTSAKNKPFETAAEKRFFKRWLGDE